MKAFVTGGTGFIGSHLVDRLIDDKSVEELRCMVRNREKWLAGKPYTRIAGDLFDLSSLRKGMEGMDTLFHAAAVVKAPGRYEFERANVEATENLIRAAQETGVNKIVILSSLAASGPSSGTPLTEEDPMNPVSMYGESKKKMEEMIHRIRAPELSISIIRPPVVYGPRETQVYSYFRMLKMRISPVIGDGETPPVSLVYVTDLINGIRLAAENQTKGVHTFFITGPGINNWNQIKNIGSKVLGKRPIPLYIRPEWVKRIAGAVETVSSVFGSYPVLNREKANELILEWTCSSRKAMNELRYVPQITLEEGISRTIHWYKKHDWL